MFRRLSRNKLCVNMFSASLGCQYLINWIRWCEACWFWSFCSNYSNNQQKEVIHRNAILDGARGESHYSVI